MASPLTVIADYDTNVHSGNNNTSYAAQTSLGLGNSTFKVHALLHFDLSGLPSGVIVTAATLSLYNYANPVVGYDLTIHRILAANAGWIEACTWNYADGAGASDRWAGDVGNNGGADAGCSVAGTDHAAATIGTFSTVASEGANVEHAVTLDLTEFASLVAANNGLIVRATTVSAQSCSFHSSESATTGCRPKLVVTYNEPAGVAVVRAPFWGRF